MRIAAMNPDAPRRLVVPYIVLIWCGTSSVINNFVHAFRHADGNWFLPGLYGIGPVLVAVCLSHIAAEGRTGKWMRTVVYAIMLASMAGSIGATAAVITPFAGLRLAWLYGLILDASAIACLQVILSDRHRKRAGITAADAARVEASEAVSRAARLEAELVAARAELDAERAKVPPRNPRSASARKPARNRGAASARKLPSTSAPEVPAEADLDTEAQALRILAAEPGISGSQLGLRLGKSDRYGRDLIKRLTVSVDDSGTSAGQ